MDFQPKRPHELLGVYRDEQTAERAIIDLREQAHAGARRGTVTDEQHALNAEMGAQPKKPLRKEGAAMFPITLLASAVVAVPIALIFGGDVSMGGRLALASGMALVMAGTITLVLMSLGGQKRPNEPMAAEQGVVVRVRTDSDQARSLMLAADPLRLDVVDDQGRPIETLTTAGDPSSVKEIGKRMPQWP